MKKRHASHSAKWKSLASRQNAEELKTILSTVGSRFKNFDLIEQTMLENVKQSPPSLPYFWTPFSIANGHSGHALFSTYLELCYPGDGWDAVAHASLEKAAEAINSGERSRVDLFSGITGYLFALWYASKVWTDYEESLSASEEILFKKIQGNLLDRKSPVHGLPFSEFDLISGYTGIGAYLLCRLSNPEATATLEAILKFLVELSEASNGLPRWFAPADPPDSGIPGLAYANFNCGLAHGFPGPLALMALSKLNGAEAPGMESSIRRVAEWFLRHRTDDPWGMNWPAAFPVERVKKTDSNESSIVAESDIEAMKPTRGGWCYGSPGIARALWLAGKAVDEPGYSESASAAMEAVCRRSLSVLQIDSPIFCHGLAGLLQILLRFVHETSHPLFKKIAVEWIQKLIFWYDPDSIFGFKHLLGGKWFDDPGLLAGSAGVFCVLSAAASDIEPIWDRVFLLS